MILFYIVHLIAVLLVQDLQAVLVQAVVQDQAVHLQIHHHQVVKLKETNPNEGKWYIKFFLHLIDIFIQLSLGQDQLQNIQNLVMLRTRIKIRKMTRRKIKESPEKKTKIKKKKLHLLLKKSKRMIKIMSKIDLGKRFTLLFAKKLYPCSHFFMLYSNVIYYE